MIQGIIDALKSTFTDLGTAILAFLKSGFETIFLNDGKTGLSNLGTFLFVMLSISLTVGLTRWITSLVRRKI